MKTPNFIFTMLQIPIILFLVLPDISNGAEDVKLSMNITPSKEEIYSGEPIQLFVAFENNGKENASIDCGPNYVEAFAIEIRDMKGLTINKSDVQKLEGFRQRGNLFIPAASTIQISLPLNRWCSTTLPEDQYKIVCHFMPWMESSVKPIDASHDLKVVKVDKNKLNIIFSNLTERAINSTNNDEKCSAYELISLSDSPLAINSQVQLVRKIPLVWRHYKITLSDRVGAIDGLKKIGSPEAVKGLISICDDTSLDNGDRDRALTAIRDLRKTGDTNILQATDDIIMKYEKRIGVESRQTTFGTNGIGSEKSAVTNE